MPRKMSFQGWVQSLGGLGATAKLLGVSSRSVMIWYHRQRPPKHANILHIVELSRGKLTYLTVVKDTAPEGEVRA